MSIQITDAQCSDIRFLLLQFINNAEIRLERFDEDSDIADLYRANRDIAQGLYEELLHKASEALRSSVPDDAAPVDAKQPIKSAGYIVHDNEVIWAVGDTEQRARDKFTAEEERQGCRYVPDDFELPERMRLALGVRYVREGDFDIRAASKALLDQINAQGGAIQWRVVDGVACTVAEDEQ